MDGFSWILDGFWIDLDGFELMWMDLDAFGWMWIDFHGFGWVLMDFGPFVVHVFHVCMSHPPVDVVAAIGAIRHVEAIIQPADIVRIVATEDFLDEIEDRVIVDF